MNEQVGWGSQQEDPGPVQEKGLCPGSESPVGAGAGGSGLERSRGPCSPRGAPFPVKFLQSDECSELAEHQPEAALGRGSRRAHRPGCGHWMNRGLLPGGCCPGDSPRLWIGWRSWQVATGPGPQSP